MAAKPKLTPKQWAEVRKTWEQDSRKGFPWLVKEMCLDVSAEAIRQKSKAEGWKKANNASLENEKTKLEKSAKNKSKTQVSEVVKSDSNSITKSLIDGSSDNAKANKNGRPTKYREEYAEQAYKLCLLGYTDKGLADFFGVAESTINEWKLDHYEFSESLKNGKDIADGEAVHRFYQRVCGYRYQETKTTMAIGEGGAQIPVEIVIHEKEVPADVGAGKVWLSNRQPKYWRDSNNSKVKVQFDTEKLNEIAENFTKAMERSKERQMTVLRERGILIDNDTGRPVDG